MPSASWSARTARVPGGGAVVIAMGKLGGREMTAASDLDLIVVYDFDAAATQSNGAAPAGADALLHAADAAPHQRPVVGDRGRHRSTRSTCACGPPGQQGPVATQLSSFIDYQAKAAWTWEHLALTRARVISGPPELRERVERAIRAALLQAARPRQDHRRRARHA